MTHLTPTRSNATFRPMRRVGVVAMILSCCVAGLHPSSVDADTPETQPAATQPAEPATQPAPEPTPAEIIASEIVKVVGQNEHEVRREAALVICRTGSQEAVAALLSVLNSQNNEAAKTAVCEAIAATRFDAPGLIEPLKALLNSPNASLQRAAASALAIYNDERVVEALAAYQERRSRLLTEQVVRDLMIRLYQATAEPARRDALLLEWLRCELPLRRLKAMNVIHDALRSTGAQPAEEVLAQVRTMTSDRDPVVRAKLVTFLRDLGMLEDAPRIAEMVVDEPSPAVRVEVYKALRKLADPQTLAVCVAGLNDPDTNVAAAAAEALGRLCERGNGQPETAVVAEVVEALLERYGINGEGDGTNAAELEPVLRRSLIEAMAGIADPNLATVLATHAGEAEVDPLIRQIAIGGLGRLDQQDHVAIVLDRLINDPEPVVRETAARVVGTLGFEPAHLAALRTRLDRDAESSTAVTNQAWEAYQNLFQRMAAAEQKKALRSWETTGPDRMIALAARVRPEARESVASFLLEYVTTLNQSDHAGAMAFLERLTKAIPDRFGADWTDQFDQACQPPQASTQPAA